MKATLAYLEDGEMTRPEPMPNWIWGWLITATLFVGAFLFFTNYHSDPQRQLCATIVDGWEIMKDREPTSYVQRQLKTQLQKDIKGCDWFLEEMHP